MKRWNTLGAVLIAALSITAAAASTASAAFPNVLPTGVTFNASSGATEFGSGITAVKSTKSKGKGATTGEKRGTFENVLEGFKDQLGRECTGLADKVSGNVTVTGTLDIRWDPTKAKVLVLFLLNPVHFACGTTLLKLKGCFAGLYESASNIPLKEATVSLAVEKGDNVPTTVENEANTGTEKCELLAEVNDEKPGLASEKAVETLKEFAKGLGATKNEFEVMTK
jgi:hypothetical protein